MRTDVDEATQKVLNTLWWDKIDQAAQVTCESKKGKQCRGQLTMESNTIDNTIAKRVVFPRGANNGDNVYCKQEHSFLCSTATIPHYIVPHYIQSNISGWGGSEYLSRNSKLSKVETIVNILFYKFVTVSNIITKPCGLLRT